MYAHYRLRRISSFQYPCSGGLHDYCCYKENRAKGGAFGSGMQLGVYIRKAMEANDPDQIEEKTNSYEYVAYYIQRIH
jgi:hypothetical protein